MRSIFFCLLLLPLTVWSQYPDKQVYPDVLQRFVESSMHSQTEKDSTKIAFAFIGTVPKGAELIRQLADSVVIIRIKEKELRRSLSAIGKLIAINDQWKLAPGFTIPASAKLISKKQTWIIQVNDVAALSVLSKSQDSVMVMHRSGNRIQLHTSWKWIEDHLLAHAAVLFIAPASIPFTERELTGFDLSANKGNLAHRQWPLITGNGQTISIKENKIDTADIDFTGRYLSSSLASQRMETHATTMATIAAGGGNTFYTGKGFAPGAAIASSDFANLLPDVLNELMRLNITVQNHSYGTGIENYYGADAAAYDDQMHTQRTNLVHVFSAGNQGTQTSTSGNYAGISGFANLTGSFKMSKNSIAVGAADSMGNVPALSSRGPAYDGRLKPELIALGEDGSSGAAAIVSGIATLVQQSYTLKNNRAPESAVVRAALFNSADDVGALGPDYNSGYGMANAFRAVQTIQDNRIIEGLVNHQEQRTHFIQIPVGAKNLKLTLCWTDPAANANAFKAIVNDLDISVQHVSTAQVWQPWVLSSFPHTDSLRKPAVRKKDALNTNEQITIDEPAAGAYEIRIHGFSVTSLTQSYAIAWQYDTVDAFLFSYPVQGDLLDPERKNTIRWEGTVTDTATLEYRLNSGNWTVAANGIDLTKKYFQWQPPDTLAAIQFRMKTIQRSWSSDTVGISRNLLINTGFNCADSFLIYWQKARVDSYRVYRLGEKYLESFSTLADTALIQYKQNNPYRFFSVAPLLPAQIEGKRAYTFDYSKQQAGCYISSFIADPSGNNSARISLQLGTTYQVEKVVFEKLTATGFSSFREITPVTTTQFIITENANNGLNIYRAKVELKNGAVYYTQPEQVVLFGLQPYYVFPNPLQPGAQLNVLVEDPDNKEFRLYDLYGRLVMKEPLPGFRNRLKMPLLQKGIYFYVIIQSQNKLLNGKLIIQ